MDCPCLLSLGRRVRGRGPRGGPPVVSPKAAGPKGGAPPGAHGVVPLGRRVRGGARRPMFRGRPAERPRDVCSPPLARVGPEPLMSPDGGRPRRAEHGGREPQGPPTPGTPTRCVHRETSASLEEEGRRQARTRGTAARAAAAAEAVAQKNRPQDRAGDLVVGLMPLGKHLTDHLRVARNAIQPSG